MGRFFRIPGVKIGLILIVVIILAAPFVLDLRRSFIQDPIEGFENHYVHLAKAILNGKVNVDVFLHDMALHDGKYYVIYPPFPVVFVLPFVAIFGLKTQLTWIGLALGIVSAMLLFRILVKLGVRKKNTSLDTSGLFPWDRLLALHAQQPGRLLVCPCSLRFCPLSCTS